jgi:hypothetical protein
MHKVGAALFAALMFVGAAACLVLAFKILSNLWGYEDDPAVTWVGFATFFTLVGCCFGYAGIRLLRGR